MKGHGKASGYRRWKETASGREGRGSAGNATKWTMTPGNDMVVRPSDKASLIRNCVNISTGLCEESSSGAPHTSTRETGLAEPASDKRDSYDVNQHNLALSSLSCFRHRHGTPCGRQWPQRPVFSHATTHSMGTPVGTSTYMMNHGR